MKKIIFPAILVLLILIVILPGFLIAVKLECQSQYGSCPAEIVNRISYLDGKKMNYAKHRLKEELNSNFLVSTYIIQFKLPNILKAEIVAKKPEFALKNKSSGYCALVDNEGVVLAVSENTQLPTVLTDRSYTETGTRVDDRDFLALGLTAGVYKMYQTGTGTIETDTLLVDLPGGIRVIFPLVGADRDFLLGALRLIYSNIQDEESGQTYSQIDLRYKNPVLR